MSSAAELLARRELLWNLTLRETRARYKRSVLGWTWSMLNPLATMLMYTFVFSVVFQTRAPIGDLSGLHSYAPFLLAGLLAWGFFNVSVGVGMESVVSNGPLVKKVAFPREHLVLAAIGAGLMTFAIEMGVLSVVLLFMGNFVLPYLPLVVVAAGLLALFAAGVSMALAAANVYLRDLKYLWTIVSQAWFFTTPIVYPASIAEERIPAWAFRIFENLPMAVTVRVFRRLLYDLRIPALTDWGLMTGYSVAALFAGWWVFRRLEGRFAEEL